jgi:hypothetical protein
LYLLCFFAVIPGDDEKKMPTDYTDFFVFSLRPFAVSSSPQAFICPKGVSTYHLQLQPIFIAVPHDAAPSPGDE